MGTVGFYIFYGVNWVVTLLPLKVLYLFSDFLFLIIYYFPSYRRKVVSENLRNSFPEKPSKELIRIGKKFYRHLADLFVETLKLTHLSNEELKKRMRLTNPELVEYLFNSGRDVVVVHSHFNNWEWVGAVFPLYSEYQTVSIYKPLQNKLFDRFLNSLRTRNNAGLAPMNHIVRKIIENQGKNIRTLYGFIADQTPAKPDIRYYTYFLNQETPVFLGIERIAAKYNMSVVFFNVQKVRRGYYELTVELLFEQTKGLPEYKVTEAHVKRLEEIIRQNPEYWIWTHRRWKYKKQD
jgi:Kdo2-lipid IVA lauroyltransferase/acyltransferase